MKNRPCLAAALATLSVLAPAPIAQALEPKLIASDGAVLDRFGSSVAVDDDTAVVGAPGDDDGRGAVYVFTRAGDGWAQTAKLTAGSEGARLGTSVAIDGDTIVAGAPSSIGGHGVVYTFARTGTPTRQHTAILVVPEFQEDERLGTSVAIDGDTIVAGAPGDNRDRGSIYTFARNGAEVRQQTATLVATDGEAGDGLGGSVDIDGEVIVAGARADDAGSSFNEGSVYTFARNGSSVRQQTSKLTASDGAENGFLGDSVAIDGDTIVAGAPSVSVGTDGAPGSVYTFARSGPATRQETAKLTASDDSESRFLGSSVAIGGDTIVAGAPASKQARGAAYTFARAGAATRQETAELTASDGVSTDTLGVSVAIDGSTILAGTPSDDVGTNAEQGSVSVFSPAVDLSPSSLDFGSRLLGRTSANRRVTMTNTGSSMLSIGSVALTGTHQADYVVTANSCAGASIAAGASCAVDVAFRPRATGVRSASLHFTDDAPSSPQAVGLSGRGCLVLIGSLCLL